MPETPPPWHSNIHVLLLHASQPAALMLPSEPGCALLHRQRPGRMWLPQVRPIPPLLAQHLGLQATVLRCVQVQEEEHQLHAVFLMENHSPHWQSPPGRQWIGRERLIDLPLARPEHREIIDTCLAESAGSALPARRAPWACQGLDGAGPGLDCRATGAAGRCPGATHRTGVAWGHCERPAGADIQQQPLLCRVVYALFQETTRNHIWRFAMCYRQFIQGRRNRI